MNEERDTSIVELTSVQGEIEEKMIVSILKAEGIEVLVKSDMAGGTLPFTADGMGRVRIFVREDEIDEARKVLKNYRENE